MNDEAALMQAVANQLVSMTVDGGDMTFQFYSGGVMTGSFGTDMDHEPLVMEWSMTTPSISSGTTWGENRFLRMDGEGHLRQEGNVWPCHAAILPD